MGRADRAESQRRHFEGKVAIVTGAASRIGKALATEPVLGSGAPGGQERRPPTRQ
ncbi:MAG TPA: hypothetical protein VG205_06260 [Acidimicrobiales bacterium]|nr:hypothetical protein [Acidimicrobiales bacterium]